MTTTSKPTYDTAEACALLANLRAKQLPDLYERARWNAAKLLVQAVRLATEEAGYRFEMRGSADMHLLLKREPRADGLVVGAALHFDTDAGALVVDAVDGADTRRLGPLAIEYDASSGKWIGTKIVRADVYPPQRQCAVVAVVERVIEALNTEPMRPPA